MRAAQAILLFAAAAGALAAAARRAASVGAAAERAGEDAPAGAAALYIDQQKPAPRGGAAATMFAPEDLSATTLKKAPTLEAGTSRNSNLRTIKLEVGARARARRARAPLARAPPRSLSRYARYAAATPVAHPRLPLQCHGYLYEKDGVWHGTPMISWWAGSKRKGTATLAYHVLQAAKQPATRRLSAEDVRSWVGQDSCRAMTATVSNPPGGLAWNADPASQFCIPITVENTAGVKNTALRLVVPANDQLAMAQKIVDYYRSCSAVIAVDKDYSAATIFRDRANDERMKAEADYEEFQDEIENRERELETLRAEISAKIEEKGKLDEYYGALERDRNGVQSAISRHQQIVTAETQEVENLLQAAAKNAVRAATARRRANGLP